MAGQGVDLFDAYFRRADLDRDGRITGSEAVTFFQAANLPKQVLAQVPECINKLAQAGIKIWVLTGDKMETAINIGFACSLLRQGMKQIIINLETPEIKALEKAGEKDVLDKASKEDVLSQINEGLAQIAASKARFEALALIIDGKSLAYALEDDVKNMFLELAVGCASVICCRSSPKQKELVTRLVKEGIGKITLAIGDGANDVGMLQEADIGVGISGAEGMQVFRREVVFLVDISGSMRVKLLDGTKRALAAALGKLDPKDKFNILAFNKETFLYSSNMKSTTQEGIDKAIQWIHTNFTVGDGTNIWVQEHLYDKRHMWSDAFVKGTFFAGMRTTQRCESLNSHQHRFMGKGLKIHKLVEGFDKEFERLRAGETLAGFKTRYGTRIIDENGPISELNAHATLVYTRDMYFKVHFEMAQSHNTVTLERKMVGTNELYILGRYRKKKKNIVVYNPSTESYDCECKHFDFCGYPCRHQIHVLKQRNLEKIPVSLILKRWTIDAKNAISVNEEIVPPELCVRVRYGSLSSICNNICRLGSQNSRSFLRSRGQLTKILDDMTTAENATTNTDSNNNIIKDPARPLREPPTKTRKKGKKKGGSNKKNTNIGLPNGTSQTSADVNSADAAGEATGGDEGGSQSGPVPSGIDTSLHPRVPRPARKCSICKKIGHTRLKCPDKILIGDDNPIHDLTQCSNRTSDTQDNDGGSQSASWC